jgi:hypothetical protein
MGVVTRASAAGLVAAGMLSVTISPTLASVLLRRRQPMTTSVLASYTARLTGRRGAKHAARARRPP